MKQLVFFFLLGILHVQAQKNIRTFVFGHSLINHESQVNPTPSQETSVPHWFYFLAEAAGHDYAVDGQFGFLPQHVNLPPVAQWGFDFVPGAWDSDNEEFAAADFSNIMITPGNFMQWQPPTANYPNENISPFSATTTIFDWCMQQEPELRFYIYENWPDMAPYLNNAFPPSSSEWEVYNEYLNGDFHDWFLEYHDLMVDQFPGTCVRMIPVGPIISSLLQTSPYDQIPVEDLYEDDAPHGRPTVYFLASLVTYMAMYEEKAPMDFVVDPIIAPVVANNYESVVDFIWEELVNFNYASGESRVFCDNPILNATIDLNTDFDIRFFPNPVKETLYLSGNFSAHSLEVYDVDGVRHLIKQPIASSNDFVELGGLSNGVYVLIGRGEAGEVLYRKRIVIFNGL